MKPTAVEWIAYESVVARGVATPLAPLMSVVLESAGRKRGALGVVDSGSEISCLPPHLAAALRLELQGPPREVRVLGGVATVRSAFCDLRVPVAHGVLTFRAVEFAVPASGEGDGLVILGQDPLFREIEIRFQGWLQRFGLQRRIGNLGFVPTAGGPAPSPRKARA